MIKFTIITLFPEALQPYLETSMMWKAAKNGAAEFNFVNLRDYGLGPHKSVDDTPYGGGDGMVLRCEPIYAAIEEIKVKDPSAEVILPTPAGETWTQALARRFASQGDAAAFEPIKRAADEPRTGSEPCGDRSERPVAQKPLGRPGKHYVILCPHYEGYDQRILPLINHQISLGHYILTGGELPALIIIDSIVRLLPGVLGGETSAEIESFSEGDNIEYPQYTKPADFRGLKVPEILLSGDHGKVAKWRKSQEKRANNAVSLK